MNILAERSFPSFFKSYAPKLLKFYSDWLDWTELPGNFHYELNHLSSEQDIDESIEAYRTHLKAKLLPEFPERTATDLKLLLKNVLWLYRAKSSRKAYDFMFRVLFNSPARIWHPRDTMLKTSDGVWDVPQYVGIVENDEVDTNWLIDNCLGWRMTGRSSRAEAFVAAASSGYSGSIECKASSIKDLARVSYYWNYGTSRQRLLSQLGTIECDPTLTAFHITNPNKLSEIIAPRYTIENGGVPNLSAVINGLTYDVDMSGYGTETATGTANETVIFTVSIDNSGIVTFNLTGSGTLTLAQPESSENAQKISGFKARLTRTYEDGEKAYAEQPLLLNAALNATTRLPSIKINEAFILQTSSSLPSNKVQTSLEIAETIVWTFNKKKMTHVVPAGTSVIELGTRNFLEPSAIAKGETDSYDVVNLEALHGGLWRTVDAVYANGVLEGKYVDGEGNEAVAFSLAIEYDGRITFTSSVPLRCKGEGTSKELLATFYVKSIQRMVRSGVKRESIRTAPVQLLAKGFGTYCISAKSLLSGDAVEAYDGESISILELVVHEDIASDANVEAEYSFEEPVSNILLTLSYSFEKGKYIVEASKPSKVPVDAICRLGGKTFTAQIPALQTEVELEVELPDPLVTIGSKNVFGILLDLPTAHFAPGEKARLLNPDTGEVAEVEPVILWHAESEGHYTSTKGFLSDINAIQDNHYWQNYSYVVQSDVGIQEWRSIVKKLLHPAGLEIFGEMMLEGTDLQDGKGIYYLEEQTYLKKFGLFFKKMVALSKMAVERANLILSSSRLAQRHSITTDLWLHWIQSTGDLRAEIKELKQELFNTIDIEERKELERQINELEAILSSPWMEDIRDWYDIRPSDIDEELNCNSVLWFRNDGTLVNPQIVDWVRFEFSSDIDESFELRGETVHPKTRSLWGTTLHPLHPMLHGSITGNEYSLDDGQEEIPNLYMAFVGSTQESSGVRVKTLVIGNEVLRYTDIQRVDIHEPALVKETDLQKYARKFLLGSQPTSTPSTGIVPWKELTNPDFIYIDTDGGLVFNKQSLLKVPDAWTSYSDRTYTFERNAWNNEKISIVSYSPYDFSYRIWIERLNGKMECSITAYNSMTAPGLPLKNSNVRIIPNVEYDANGKEISRRDDEVNTELVYVQESGWNGPSTEVYATTRKWKLEFNDPSRVSSWFDLQLPEVVDNDLILCFVNGLLQPKSRIENGRISVDTVKDNSSIVYSSTRWEFGELSLEEFVLNEEGTDYVLDENGIPMTRLVMVSTNESDNVPFGEITLEDWLVVNEDIDRIKLPNFTLQGVVFNIIGCSISDTLSYAEIYILAPIEGSRKLQYSWHGWKTEADWNNDGIADVDAHENPLYVWPFTYDNARIFPYSAHNEAITSVRDAELNPDKEAILPKIHWEVQYHNVSRLLNGFKHHLLVTETIASQKQSETVDRILNTWFDDATSRLRTDFFKNEHWMAAANFSSTLLFNEEGILIDPTEIDWAGCLAHGLQEYGVPEKWWSRPMQAEHPARYGTVSDGGITWSGIEDFDPEGRLVFVDGLKVLDSDIASNAAIPASMEDKDAIAFSMGRDWLMQGDTHAGWFGLKKDSNGWTVQAKINGEYASIDHLDRLQEIDLVEFVGLSLGRRHGTIWSADGSTFEIKGTTEVSSVIGDKRRFVDLTFLDKVDIYQPDTTQRLYSVVNSWIFGIVDRIVDVDPRFFMVFIDGHHSPMESHEWRYIKGSFFVEVEPERSVEVYIGNPYSHLAPDFAKTAPSAIEDLVFNNLRINPVPRHHTTLSDWKEMGLILGCMRKHVIEWRHLYKTGITGYLHELRTRNLQVVQKQSETFDDILYWKQMLPNAWLDVEDPMKMSNKSSMLVFDSNGDLVDPIRIDWHRKLMVPESYGNTVEVMSPASILYTGQIYFPAWAYDASEDHMLHKELYVLDGKREGRYRNLIESNWDIVYIDNVAYNYDQWYQKQFADLHLEESVFVNEYPETSEGENLLLTDEILDQMQKASTMDGDLHSFQIEAVRQSVRALVVGSQAMDLAVEVPSIFGAMVFVDGRKVPEGSYIQRITRNNVEYRQGTNLQESDIPRSGKVRQYIVLDGTTYGDSTEHIVNIYWPANEYGKPIQEGNLCSLLYSNSEYVFWEGIWRSVCMETFECDSPALQNELQRLLENSGFNQAIKKWLKTQNGIEFATRFHLSDDTTSAQMASTIVQYAPSALPLFVTGLQNTINDIYFVELYKLFASYIRIDPPLVEQFREYVKNRFLLFVDGHQIPLSVDSSGRIVMLSSNGILSDILSEVNIFEDYEYEWKVLGPGENIDSLEFVAIDVQPTDSNWIPILENVDVLATPDYVEAALNGTLDIEDRTIQLESGLTVVIHVDRFGKVYATLSTRQVFVENYNPASFELYCIDLSNTVLRTSATTSAEDYQSLHFQNLRLFPFVEVDTRLNDFKMYDWKIQYFLSSHHFKTESVVYMNRIGWQNFSKIASTIKANVPYETIDDVLQNQHMDPSAWSGLDFDILSKSGKSSIMVFGDDGTLVDPFDVDFSRKEVNAWHAGKVVEILLPNDAARMSKIYWPIYAVDPDEHRLPYIDSRFKDLRESEFSIAVVDGLTFDVERNLGKEIQDIHNEESAWIYPRPDTVFEESRYSSFLEASGWDNATRIDSDSEHLLLTDVLAQSDEEDVNGTITGVAIDAESAMHRSVVTVLENGPFIVQVPRVNGELVFVDGTKIAEGSFKRNVYVNGTLRKSSIEPINLDEFAGLNGVEYAIEILDPVWKDNDEHIAVIYWPNHSWSERHASPENLRNSIISSLESGWKDEYGLDTYNDYIKSRFILFCNGILAACTANADGAIFINGIPLSSYRCSNYELYVVDLSNRNCRTSTSSCDEGTQAFIFDNQQRNWFMESHHDNALYRMHGLPPVSCKTFETKEIQQVAEMPVLKSGSEVLFNNEFFVANNRDTLDNVFCNGSIPVRQYVNPSLYVETISKFEIANNDFYWKVLASGENIDDLDFVAIDVHMLNGSGEVDALVDMDNIVHIVDGKAVFETDYVPQSWNFTIYATSRENPEWFLPCERLDASHWMFYKGWNQRFEFIGLEPDKDLYILETFDVSMPDSIANTDWVYWLEKEFNKKSTLIIDNEGLLEHPEGLEWCNGVHIFPHEGTWTAQAEEAEFPAVINELVPDNIRKRQIMELCIDDMVGYDSGINLVGDACIDSLVAVNARVYRKEHWEVLANRDYIYWEEGEFKNWIAWLRDDDVFDPWKCFVFVNGFKIPDWAWTFDADANTVTIPLYERCLIERLGFVKKKNIYDERIHEENIQTVLIDPELRPVQELEEDAVVIVDSWWATWKDKEGFPVWGGIEEIPDEETEVLVDMPDPREGIIWPIARIWKYFNSCTSAGIDIPEYLGHDLSKYVLAWVDGRLVQCTFEGTRIFVPGCESAETVEVYVFELHDEAWIERFNAVPESYTLTSFRDMKVC